MKMPPHHDLKNLHRLLNNPAIKNILFLGLALLAAGCLSILMGQDASVDLLNYHLYTPFAFLHRRFYWDIIPAGMHTFFNPLLDVPYYLLFTHLNDYPRLTAFIQGLWYGIFLFFGWKVTALVFPQFKQAQDKLIRLNAFILAVTGIAALSQIGLSSNEVPLAAGVVWVCYAFLSNRYTAPAFFLLGALFGLKYTFGPAAAGLGLMGLYLLCKNKHPRKYILWCLAACAAGFLLTNGFFMWRLYKVFENPFFPFFNRFFQSPFFDPINLTNGPGTPTNWQQWLFLPFLRRTLNVVEYQLDTRLCLGLVSFIGLAALWAWHKIRHTQEKLSPCLVPLLILFGVSYILWLYSFGVMRYSILLEFASALLFLLLLRRLLGPATAGAACTLLTLYLLLTPLPDWGRTAFQNKNSTAKVPEIEDNALVLLAGHVSFLVPLANPHAKYIGGFWFLPAQYPVQMGFMAKRLNILQPDDYRFHFEQPVRQEIDRHPGPIYILGPNSPVVTDERTWEKYRLSVADPKTNCKKFYANMDNIYGGFLLCPAQKIPRK